MRLDREVVELLRNEPELLAVADAIIATQPLDTMAAPDFRRIMADRDAEAGER